MKHIFLSLAFIPFTIQTGSPVICLNIKPPPDPRQEKCLATMIYGEARGEVERGMVAVAYTAINRSAKKTVCAVVLSPKQYSIFNNNPALKAAAVSTNLNPLQKNVIDVKSWERAKAIAKGVMRREIIDPTAGATHYLAPGLMKIKGYKFPKWSKQYKLTATIDNHKFYKAVDNAVVRL